MQAGPRIKQETSGKIKLSSICIMVTFLLVGCLAGYMFARIQNNASETKVQGAMVSLEDPYLTPSPLTDFSSLPYKVKITGNKDDVFCDFKDPVVNLACLSHDAAMGAAPDWYSEESRKLAIALESASLIQKIASSARYALYVSRAGAANKSPNIHECAVDFYGLCGNHQAIFNKVMDYLGIKSRVVSIYYINHKGERNNHAMSEVFTDGKWRLIDISFGTVYLEDKKDSLSLMSLDDIFDESKTPDYISSNELDTWFKNNNLRYSDLKLGDKKLFLVQYGLSGEIKIKLSKPWEKFIHIPNFLGAAAPNEEMSLSLTIPKHLTGIWDLHLQGTACESEGLFLKVNGKKTEVKPGHNNLVFHERTKLEFVTKPDEVCYIVINELRHKTKDAQVPS